MYEQSNAQLIDRQTAVQVSKFHAPTASEHAPLIFLLRKELSPFSMQGCGWKY
jgi:hypothetical protein